MLSPKEMYKQYQEQSNMLLPALTYKKAVSEERQRKEINLLKETLHWDRFFFVMNLHRMELEQVHGVRKWLGYPDETFNVQKLLQIIHPNHLPGHHISATFLIEGLMKGEWPVEFMKYRFNGTIALRHANGKYLFCRRLNSVFQYSLPERRLLEYISEFAIVNDYSEESFTGTITGESGEKQNWMNDVMKKMKAAFENRNLFSVQQLRILRKLAWQENITKAAICKAFKIKDSTYETHSDRIREKAQELFQKKFTNAKAVAMFLRKQGMI